MVRLLLRAALWLTTALVMPLAAVHALPHPDSALPAILASLENCPAPCFMGIRPGVTSLAGAIDLLRAHEWVASVEVQSYEVDVRGLRGDGWLIWHWSDSRPDLIDGAHPGRIGFAQAFEQVVVESIDIHTAIRPYDLRQWFGAPESSIAALNNDETISYLFTYRAYTIKTALDCPTNLLDYWNSHAEIVMRAAQGAGDRIQIASGQGMDARRSDCLAGWHNALAAATG